MFPVQCRDYLPTSEVINLDTVKSFLLSPSVKLAFSSSKMCTENLAHFVILFPHFKNIHTLNLSEVLKKAPPPRGYRTKYFNGMEVYFMSFMISV